MRHTLNPMGLETTTLTLPAHWASYFVNGETEGLSAHDLSVAQSCESLFGACTGCSDEAFFQAFHDASADGVLPGDCLAYTFMDNAKEYGV